MNVDDPVIKRRVRTRIARRRGALSGLILMLLGMWGALIPFIGPSFNFAYTPDTSSWIWTSSRGWLEVLPGVAATLGGLLVLVSSSRVMAVLGALLGAAAGAWFVVGQSLVPVLHTGDVGSPASDRAGVRVLETLAFFDGLGVLIVFFAAAAFGRLSVSSQADIRFAQRSVESEESEARALLQKTQSRENEPKVVTPASHGAHEDPASFRDEYEDSSQVAEGRSSQDA
jgi:hypothetical protein